MFSRSVFGFTQPPGGAMRVKGAYECLRTLQPCAACRRLFGARLEVLPAEGLMPWRVAEAPMPVGYVWAVYPQGHTTQCTER